MRAVKDGFVAYSKSNESWATKDDSFFVSVRKSHITEENQNTKTIDQFYCDVPTVCSVRAAKMKIPPNKRNREWEWVIQEYKNNVMVNETNLNF